MKFCCIDDDKDFLLELKNKIIEYSIKKNLDLKLEILSEIPKNIPVDVDAFFLDVKFNNKDIFDFVDTIRQKDISVPIIILSNYDFYVNKSVKFNIFDFIRKRHFDNEITATLERLVIYLEKLLPIIFIKTNDYEKYLKVKDIVYIETFSHETVINTINDSLTVRKDTKNILKDKSRYFIRIHRSYYINPLFVQNKNKNSISLTNGVFIPIGRKYLKKIDAIRI